MPGTISLHHGDNRIVLRGMIDRGEFFHAVVTDPPYGLTSVVNRFGGKNAAPAKDGKDGSFRRLSGGFMGKCFHPDTELLTSSGWVKVDEIEIGDIVATLNPHTRSTEWQPVAQTHRYPFDGELVHVKHRSAEQMITANHKMLVSHDGGESLELLTPRELKKSFHLFAQSAPQIGRNDDVVIRSVREYGKDRGEYRASEQTFAASAFFRFFGLWLGDGYCTARSNDHPANDFFGINVKKKRKMEAVRSALMDIGIKFTETLAANGFTTFYCYDFALLGWLKLLGGSKEKRIPGFLLDWDAEHLEHLYQGLMDSDGCRQGKNQEVFQTSSKQLADDFQRLCFATGRSCSIALRSGGKEVLIGGRKTVSSDAWVCCVLQQGKRMYGENSPTSSNVVYSAPYSGNVLCIGVPEHHIIYTRFNGKPVWSGNSWDGTQIERDPEFWRLVYDVLLPGGYCFAFSGSRTGHWQAVSMEQAGFIMHQMHVWAYGQGFPKPVNAARAIDKHLGHEAVVLSEKPAYGIGGKTTFNGHAEGATAKEWGEPVSDEAKQWDGWGYGTAAQKPALEPIYLAQKPFSEATGPANLLKHGVGAVNLKDCMVGDEPRVTPRAGNKPGGNSYNLSVKGMPQDAGDRITSGRYPSNLITDGSPGVLAMLPGATDYFHKFPLNEDDYLLAQEAGLIGDDVGNAMVYHTKAADKDRRGSEHPTVKPVALMQYLIRHVAPRGSRILDPFAGSGTTGIAARREGMDCVLIEQEDEYAEFLKSRFGIEAEAVPTSDAPGARVRQRIRPTEEQPRTRVRVRP